MSIHAIVPPFGNRSGHDLTLPQDRIPQNRVSQLNARKGPLAPLTFRFPAQSAIDEGTYRQAELFYLQKQIQSQTPMVIVLEDGEQVNVAQPQQSQGAQGQASQSQPSGQNNNQTKGSKK